MSKLKLIVIVIAILLVGAFAGRITAPVKVKETEKIVYKEQEQVIKVVEKRIVVRVNRDGSTETTTEQGVKELQTRNTESTTSKSKTVSKQKEWSISLLALKPAERQVLNPVYGLHIQREVLPSISVGILGATNKTIGVSVGISF